MTRIEKAYLAGIIDGEGTITLTKKHKNNTPSPQLSVSNTDLTLLQYIRKITGCGSITAKRKIKPHHKPSWVWKTGTSETLYLLRELLPFLRVKRAQADLILTYYKSVTPRNGRYTPELWARKEWLVKQIRALNMRKGKNL